MYNILRITREELKRRLNIAKWIVLAVVAYGLTMQLLIFIRYS